MGGTGRDTGDIRVHLGELGCGVRGPGGQTQRSEEVRGSLGCRGQLGKVGGSWRCGIGEAFVEVRRTGGVTGGTTGGQPGTGG